MAHTHRTDLRDVFLLTYDAHDHLADCQIVNNELAVIAEYWAHDGLLAEFAAARAVAAEKGLDGIDEEARSMRLQLDRRNGYDVLALLQSAVPCFLHLTLRRDVFNVDNLFDRRQLQYTRDLIDHVLGSPKDEDAMRPALGDSRTHLFRMSRQDEDGAAHCHDLAFLHLGGRAGDNLAVLDQNAIINDGVRLMLMRHEQGAVAFACAARTYECYDVHIFLSCFFKKLQRGEFPAKSLQKGIQPP